MCRSPVIMYVRRRRRTDADLYFRMFAASALAAVFMLRSSRPGPVVVGVEIAKLCRAEVIRVPDQMHLNLRGRRGLSHESVCHRC
jgi:hypothetical protein